MTVLRAGICWFRVSFFHHVLALTAGQQPLGLPPQNGGMHASGIFAGLGVGLLICFGFGSLLLFAFWLWMLIDCLTRDFAQPNDKLVWTVVIILLSLLGALVYFFVGRSRGARPGG